MKNRKNDYALLGISIGGFLLMSISFLLMPVESLGIAPGILFWCGLIIGIALQITLEVRRRAFLTAHKVNRKKMQKPRNGMLTFASNRWAKIADIAALVSLIATILTFIITKGYGYICFVCIAVFLFSFCMHCILNGRNYFHINNKDKVQQILEVKKERLSKKGEEKK